MNLPFFRRLEAAWKGSPRSKWKMGFVGLDAEVKFPCSIRVSMICEYLVQWVETVWVRWLMDFSMLILWWGKSYDGVSRRVLVDCGRRKEFELMKVVCFIVLMGLPKRKVSWWWLFGQGCWSLILWQVDRVVGMFTMLVCWQWKWC